MRQGHRIAGRPRDGDGRRLALRAGLLAVAGLVTGFFAVGTAAADETEPTAGSDSTGLEFDAALEAGAICIVPPGDFLTCTGGGGFSLEFRWPMSDTVVVGLRHADLITSFPFGANDGEFVLGSWSWWARYGPVELVSAVSSTSALAALAVADGLRLDFALGLFDLFYADEAALWHFGLSFRAGLDVRLIDVPLALWLRIAIDADWFMMAYTRLLLLPTAGLVFEFPS